jgi:V-type H+-transporting ATPase subunit D
MNLKIYKDKLKNAKKGFELLKRKADALTKKFNELNEQLYTAKLCMGNGFTQCRLSLA